MFAQNQKNSKTKITLWGMSPLAFLTLTACGGGSTDSSGGYSSTSVSGAVVKGPLSNALVGLDYDGDGVIDSATVRTNADGSYSLSTTSSIYTVIAITDDSTIDTSSGATLSGVTLSAPTGAAVVTPTTTLMEKGGLTKEQVAEVLGLPDGVDPLTFNPYAVEVNPDDALAVEKASQQIISVINAFAGAAEGAGANESDAFQAALNSVVEVVKVKAAASEFMDLTDASDLALIKNEVINEVASTADVNTVAFNALADDTAIAIKNVNDKIETVSDLTSDTTKNIFSTTQTLADDVKTATTAEASNSGSGVISYTDANVVVAAATNAAPTDIELSETSISEGANSLIVGVLATTDTDQPTGTAFKYKIAEVDGTDYAAFALDHVTGELSLKDQPDFETKSSYKVVITSTDAGGKTYSKTFEITIEDANDTPVGVADTVTATEDTAVTYTAATLLGNDTDADSDTLSIKSVTSGTGGTVVLNQDGTVTFTPTANFNGAGSFSYIATDGTADTAATTVTVNVSAVDDTVVKFMVDVTALDGLGAVIDSDVTAAADKVSSFYNDPDAGAFALLSTISGDTFGETQQGGDFQVTSDGITISDADGYAIDLSFTNFSPTSLAELQGVVEAANASGNISDLTISGGFKSLSLLNPDGSTIVSLSHGDDGITWSNPNLSSGGVESFVIEGTFGNQIQDYLTLMSQIQTDVQNVNIADSDVFLNAYNSLTDLVQFEGISARIDGKDLISIRGDGSGEQTTVTIAGAEADHEITLGVAGSAEFASGLIEAAGGLSDFIDFALAGGTVRANAQDAYSGKWYDEWTTIGGNEQYYSTGADIISAEDYLFEDPIGDNFTEMPDIETWSRFIYSTQFDSQISRSEYDTLKSIILNVQNYIESSPSPLDNLSFSFNYSYNSKDIISLNASDITSLIPDQDTENFVLMDSTDSQGNDVTTIIDGNERISLSLVGVEKTEFDATLADYGNDLGATIDSFLDVFVDYSSQTILATPETV